MSHTMLKTLTGLALMLGLSACQTSMLKSFEKIHPGMEKNDVLEVMGSPQKTIRFHGKDRWTYVFYDKNIRFEKEVHFFEGNAVYVGEIWQPEVSAATVDAKNESSNKALDQDLVKQYQDNPKAYINYENEVRGVDKVRYVPTFKPIQ